MTPEQRERKQQADRERRARLKAQGLDAAAIRAGAPQAMKKSRPALLKTSRKQIRAALDAIPAALEHALAKQGMPPVKTKLASSPFPTVASARAARELPPPVKPRYDGTGEGPMVVIVFKGHTHHKAKLQRLGGGAWARQAIDDAKE